MYNRRKFIIKCTCTMYLLYSGLSETIESVTVVESGEDLREITWNDMKRRQSYSSINMQIHIAYTHVHVILCLCTLWM